MAEVVRRGDLVWYHGSIKSAHGMYRVFLVDPYNVAPYNDAGVLLGEERFEIHPLDAENLRRLYNTRRQSITLIRRKLDMHG